MNDTKLELILQHPDFQQLIDKKTRLSWSLTGIGAARAGQKH